MDLSFFFFFSVMAFILEQEASTSSSPVPAHYAGKDLLVTSASRTHRREKRCSCENLKDKECVYFCHIGVVWVNTPSQIIPYGVGSLRLRRDVRRCCCVNKEDAVCLKFCSNWYSQAKNASVFRSPHRISKERFKAIVKERKNSPGLKT